MRIVICGAGHVGTFAAEVLAAARHSITVIDKDADRVRAIGDRFDVATLVGNCAHAETLKEADVAGADLVIAATEFDEVNLVTASIAKGLGASKSVARVHLGAFYDERRFGYARHLAIDRLICPEYATSEQIAHILRNPAAIAIESFANWSIELQEIAVADKAPGIGKPLAELALPQGALLVAVTRNGDAFAPTGSTEIRPGDEIVLVGEPAAMAKAAKLFGEQRTERRDIVVMGGGPMAIWLCRALRDRAFRIRLFEPDRQRAEQLAIDMEWVTVLNADATNQAVFKEEHIGRADVFVAITDDDESNILGGAWAKSQGVKQAIAVVQRPIYLHLLEHVGIDLAFSPRTAAMREINLLLEESPVIALSSLARGVLDVYSARVEPGSPVAGKTLMEHPIPERFVVAAVQHLGEAFVPDGTSTIHAGDTLLVVGPHKESGKLRKLVSG
jgi:trk system potassium uptake protein TrkA